MNRKYTLTVAVIVALQLTVSAQQTAEITASGIGYLQYLPNGYHSNSNEYPIVIALHGIMEKGTSSTNPALVFKDLPKVAYVGLPRYVRQGKNYPFILISPQLKNNYGSWPPSFVIEVLNHVRKHLRIDDKRIYLTGLSLGGLGVWKTAGEYPAIFAAIVPICSGGNALDKARAIAAENVATWGFHGSSDNIVSYTVTTQMIYAINTAPKKPNPLAKVTIFPHMGHDVWDRAYQETNVLDWMLSFRNGSRSTSDDFNTPPIADAGNDQTITLPVNAVQLKGKASDEDGKVVSHKWTQTSGGNVQLDGTAHEELSVSGLSVGTYAFKFTVEDNDGASTSDEVKVIVKKSVNKAPVVNAGGDRTISLPENSVTLEGTATDDDGVVIAYKWTKISGGNAQLEQTSSRAFTASTLTEGEYVFRLTAKDDDGATASDEVKVTVKAAANEAPIANAGGDHTIMLPANSVTLEGTASDAGGEIVAYQWTKISGGAASLSGATGAIVSVTDLKEGTYLFRLSVKDNDGAVAWDDVNVTVRKAAPDNKPPVVSAGSDQSLRLPANTVDLRGSANDQDGSIAAYTWTQVFGLAATFSDIHSEILRVSDLEAGTYIFRLTVADDRGATNSDEVSIIITDSWNTTIQPVGYEVNDRSTELPFKISNPFNEWLYGGNN